MLLKILGILAFMWFPLIVTAEQCYEFKEEKSEAFQNLELYIETNYHIEICVSEQRKYVYVYSPIFTSGRLNYFSKDLYSYKYFKGKYYWSGTRDKGGKHFGLMVCDNKRSKCASKHDFFETKKLTLGFIKYLLDLDINAYIQALREDRYPLKISQTDDFYEEDDVNIKITSIMPIYNRITESYFYELKGYDGGLAVKLNFDLDNKGKLGVLESSKLVYTLY